MGVFWRCYYHLVWTTKKRAPILSSDVETKVFGLIREKSVELATPLIAVGGTSDHIHIAVSIPPRLSVSEWVRTIKGFTAFEMNKLYPDRSDRFQWQGGYGVLTFGERQITFVTDYIHNQKQHHADKTLYAGLEDVGTED